MEYRPYGVAARSTQEYNCRCHSCARQCLEVEQLLHHFDPAHLRDESQRRRCDSCHALRIPNFNDASANRSRRTVWQRTNVAIGRMLISPVQSSRVESSRVESSGSERRAGSLAYAFFAQCLVGEKLGAMQRCAAAADDRLAYRVGACSNSTAVLLHGVRCTLQHAAL